MISGESESHTENRRVFGLYHHVVLFYDHTSNIRENCLLRMSYCEFEKRNKNGRDNCNINLNKTMSSNCESFTSLLLALTVGLPLNQSLPI